MSGETEPLLRDNRTHSNEAQATDARSPSTGDVDTHTEQTLHHVPPLHFPPAQHRSQSTASRLDSVGTPMSAPSVLMQTLVTDRDYSAATSDLAIGTTPLLAADPDSDFPYPLKKTKSRMLKCKQRVEDGIGETWKSLVFCLVLDNPYDPAVPLPWVDETLLRGNPPTSRDEGTFLADDAFLLEAETTALHAKLLSKLRKGSSKAGGSESREKLIPDDEKAGPSESTTLKMQDSTGGRPTMEPLRSEVLAEHTDSAYRYDPDSPSCPRPKRGVGEDRSFSKGKRRTSTSTSTGPVAPNRAQKVIDLLLRLETRGLAYEPAELLEPVPMEEQDPDDPYQFHGFRINQKRLLVSPDEDEMYLKITVDRAALVAFAERQGIRFATNPYSYTGGAAFTFRRERDQKCVDTANLYAKKYPHVRKEFLLDDDEPLWGYRIDVPQQMRLLTRLLREGWQYGGCGFPLFELRKKQVFVKQFFPLHNRRAQAKLGLDTWSSYKAILTRDVLRCKMRELVFYLGERVALYFVWLRAYVLHMLPLAVIGVPFGIIAQLNIDRSLVDGFFGMFVVGWAVWWNATWSRTEKGFAAYFAQGIESKQVTLRDEFVPSRLVEMDIAALFEKKFELPLSLKSGMDGTLWEARSPSARRILIRAFVTYPAVIILTAAMLAAITSLTWWRLQHQSVFYIRYGASVLTVLVGFVFGEIFDELVPRLNALENNRTEEEEEAQEVYKGFFFYFCSSYYALFALEFWPDSLSPEPISNESRIDQMFAQMLIITVLRPMVQNMLELLVPWLKGKFRRRRDKLGGSSCAAICSLLTCREVKFTDWRSRSDAEMYRLWKASTKEPYISPLQDYLEIAIQFGYMAMFAAVFPWGPLACFVYNLLEMRIDAIKLLQHNQRPIAQVAESIGPWKVLFWMLTVLSIGNNAYIISFLSSATRRFGLAVNAENKFAIFTGVQYVLVVVGCLVYLLAGRTPATVLKQVAKESVLSEVSVYTNLIQKLQLEAGNESIAANASVVRHMLNGDTVHNWLNEGHRSKQSKHD